MRLRVVIRHALHRRYRLRHPMMRRTIAAAFVLTSVASLVATSAASAAPASSPDWQARDWAMACMSCHNASAPVTAGKPALPTLEGRPVAELMTVLQAMRDGRRSATLMPQLLKGYRDDELQRIAAYFAAQPATQAASASPRQSQ